jgi:hypothetical protein
MNRWRVRSPPERRTSPQEGRSDRASRFHADHAVRLATAHCSAGCDKLGDTIAAGRVAEMISAMRAGKPPVP